MTTETLAYGYSYESTQRELSNEYQHDRVLMIFKNLCVLVLWTKVASALEGLSKASLNEEPAMHYRESTNEVTPFYQKMAGPNYADA